MPHDTDTDTDTDTPKHIITTTTIDGVDYPTYRTDDGYIFYLITDPDGTRVWATQLDPALRDITLDGDADLDLLYMN